MHGREGDRWHRSLEGLPIDEFLNQIEQAGFRAIYIDRSGYVDGGNELETKLKQRLCREPEVHTSGWLSCFVLSPRPAGPTLASD